MNSRTLKAIILAAGKGTRMKSECPKVLHKILGKTLIERTFNTIRPLNINEIFPVVGHKSEIVKEEIEKFNLDNINCVLQEPQLGTGHAVFQVYDFLDNFDGTVLVLCGDTPLLTSKTLIKFTENHLNSNADVSILSASVDNPKNYGRIVRDASNLVIKIVEEKDANQQEKQINEVNTGVYCLKWNKISRAFLEMSTDNAQGEYYLTDIVEWAKNKGLVVNAENISSEIEMFGINSRADLAKASKFLNDVKIQSLLNEGVTIVDPNNTWISPETTIEPETTILPGCYIEGYNSIQGNCTIGPNVYITGNTKIGENSTVTMSRLSDVTVGSNCSIGPFANLRNNVILNDNVRIGNFVEVKNSTINSNTNAAHLSYIGDAELGTEVNIGAGTITANYDPLTQIKSKTVICNKVKIGSNSVLVAPVTINESANVAAGSVITKDVPESSLAISRQKQTVLENWTTKKLKKLKSKINT